MEKLVKLLNEYEKDKYGISWSYELEIDDETGEPTWWIVDSSEDYFEVTSYYITMKIISKRFWFIERLVKNDKLKDNGIKPRKDLVKEIAIVDYKTGKAMWCKNLYSESEQLIMYLSIQDNPIEYLCSILK